MLPRQTILNIILAPLVVLVAFMVVKNWIANKPAPRSRKPPSIVAKVAVLESSPAEHTPTITTFGNVQAFQQTQVASQVGGKIISVAENFQAGKSVAFEEILLTIDQADYLAAIENQKSALASAEKTLAEEESRSRIALQDWLDSGREPADAPPFTLRKPQLAAATADVASATAALSKAELDLQRTEVRAPFAAIVQERIASPGNVVNAGTTLGRLIDRSRVEVRLPLTPEQVIRLDLPLAFADGEPNLTATLTTPSQPGKSWIAAIKRTEPATDTNNQVVFVVADIEAPFDDPDSFLPIGAFVNATLAAQPIADAHRLPESSLVDDRYVWVLTPDNVLRKQPVERLFSDSGFFLATIAKPVSDPPLRIAIRPLHSFGEGDIAEALDPNTPKGPRKKGGGPRTERKKK